MREVDCLLPTTPGTMSLHQIVCTSEGKFCYRDVSCFCSVDKLSCNCFNVKEFMYLTNLYSENVPSKTTGNKENLVDELDLAADKNWWLLESVSESVAGKHCLVIYDGKPFPGKIINVDVASQECYVQCICKIGTKSPSFHLLV